MTPHATPTSRHRREPVTAFVITLNEEANIRACLESVAWADQRLVVDSGSTDRTREIAREMGATVVERPWNGINEQRQAGLEHCLHDWVFCLDADERATPELGREILRALAPPTHHGYRIPRVAWHLGRWIRHCGWYPDYKLRLFSRSHGRFAGTDPHDRFDLATEPGTLESEIRHFSYDDFADQIRTINSFSSAACVQGRTSILAMLFKPPWKFFEVYVVKLGILDGLAGFVIAVASAFNVFARQVKRRERSLP